MGTPREYGLTHDEFRPNQAETIEWAHNDARIKILEAPTGSGKTAIARALAQSKRTMALVRTKALQEDNYEHGYGFTPLYGKANYACIHAGVQANTKADRCFFSEEGMHKCPEALLCPYLSAKAAAIESDMTTLNYAYWLHVYNKWPEFEQLVCDEAHELSSIVLEWAGITITEKDRDDWELPSFPILRSGGSVSILTPSLPVEEKACDWLREVRKCVNDAYNHYNNDKSNNESRKLARKAELFVKKIRATIAALELSQNDWYIRSGPNVRPYDSHSSWAFIARPLTARHHFKSYFFNRSWDLMLMSATIGNREAFAYELGIGEHEFRSVPSNWPAKVRPIHALDVPRLGYKSSPSDWQHQAEQIAKLIKSAPSYWHGIIHVTSIEESGKLARRLSSLGLQDRVYVAKRASTNEMVADWREQMRKQPGSILISWALWEGYNGLDEKINIAAKVPYPFLGDPYEIERRNHNGSFFLQRAAWQLEQGLGRTRRGRAEDYDLDGKSQGLVAIADGGYKWLRKYFSPSFMESLITS